MAVKAWLAAHTGLPSLYSDEPASVVCGDGRVLHGQARRGPMMVSDALAQPGIPTTYTVGDHAFVLTRPEGEPGKGLVSGLDGRAFTGVWAVDNEDPLEWDSEATVYPSGAVRWARHTPHTKGSSELVTSSPRDEATILRILKAREPIIIGPATRIDGVPLRCVVPNSVNRKRDRQARLHLTVGWTLLDPKRVNGGAAPILTWSDYQDQHTTWQEDVAYMDVLRSRAGMPL